MTRACPAPPPQVLPASYAQVPLTCQATPDSLSEGSDIEMKADD